MQLDQISIVLVEPSHPGNIGAAARAMKTMGLSRLVLVNPRRFPDDEATRRAAGAESVLNQALVVSDLATALGNIDCVVGTSVRDREVGWPTKTPRETADYINQKLNDDASQVAILFGRENSGLTNAELESCQAQVRIPANSEYSSLNLASAVQIIAYELRCKSLEDVETDTQVEKNGSLKQRQQAASTAQKQGHLDHLQQTLEDIDFVRTKPPTQLMRKLSRLYNKADLTVEEIQILRGILTAINEKL